MLSSCSIIIDREGWKEQMEKWFVSMKKADFAAWAQEFRISPILARILRNRNLTEEDEIRKFLYGTLADCYSPWLFRDMDRAVEAILQSVHAGERIRVIGDYDVDGISASYILTKGFALLGAQVDTAIPHRVHDGYGLNEHLIEEAKKDGISLIVTCDNGIAAAEQIAMANEMGIAVVVTDHHEVPYSVEADGSRTELLPKAVAIVDPKRKECTYPFPGICGATVAFKLIQALAEKSGIPALIDVQEELLQIVALATVCDVMDLVDENRILVREGLKRMAHSRNEGIRALFAVNELDPASASVYHLGFVLGPSINSIGRLDTAKRALELLQSYTKADAMTIARELKDINDSRKTLTLQGTEAACALIESEGMAQDKVLVVFLPEVHESLAGIIAGRVRERYERPTIILTRAEEGAKGSGRSVEAYHMYDALTEVKHFFTKFGGHAMAAGLSMAEEDIPALRTALNENCKLTDADFVKRVEIDMPMPLSYASMELAEELSCLEPCGNGNPRPLFAEKNVTFVGGFRMGSAGTSARYRVAGADGRQQTLVLLGGAKQFESFLAAKYGVESVDKLYAGQGAYQMSVVYRPEINAFRGKHELQLKLLHYC